MAKQVLLNVRLFAGAADLTSRSNKVELAMELEEKDATAFRAADDPDAGWKELRGGLGSTSIKASGQWEAGDAGMVDDSTWSALSGRRIDPWTICPVSADVGELAYFTGALRSSYKLGDAVGEIAPWEGDAKGDGLAVRGVSAHPPGTARTADGTGTGLELGALTADQRLHANLHVLSVSGTTPELTVRIESAPDNTFAAPTTRLTFDAASATPVPPRGQVDSVAGAVTDTWWRAAWTITGTDPSFLFVAALGIA